MKVGDMGVTVHDHLVMVRVGVTSREAVVVSVGVVPVGVFVFMVVQECIMSVLMVV